MCVTSLRLTKQDDHLYTRFSVANQCWRNARNCIRHHLCPGFSYRRMCMDGEIRHLVTGCTNDEYAIETETALNLDARAGLE